MTDEQITELLAHPRVQTFVRRVADEAVFKALTTNQGELTYEDAALYIGCPRDSVRGYVHRGELARGTARGKVTIASCAKFKRTYRPSTAAS